MPATGARLITAAALVVAAAVSWWFLVRSGAVMATMSGDGRSSTSHSP